MRSFLLMLMLVVSSFICTEQDSKQVSLLCSVPQRISSWWSATDRRIEGRSVGYLLLGGAIVYGLYRVVKHIMYEQEERIIHLQEREIQPVAITKEDYGHICALVQAMEEDILLFNDRPYHVENMSTPSFNDEMMASGFEEMQRHFCTLYEECLANPIGKSVIAELVARFKQILAEYLTVID